MPLILLCILAGALAAYHMLLAMAGSRAVGIEKVVKQHEARCKAIMDDPAVK